MKLPNPRQKIQEFIALPGLPTHVTDFVPLKGVRIRMSVGNTGPQRQWKRADGKGVKGGAIQYEIIQNPAESWFTKPVEIGK